VDKMWKELDQKLNQQRQKMKPSGKLPERESR
jgi:hypothetical protein